MTITDATVRTAIGRTFTVYAPDGHDNPFAGVDYAGPAGVARWSVEDGEVHVYVFDRNDQVEWEAIFTDGTPDAVITDTVARAWHAVGL